MGETGQREIELARLRHEAEVLLDRAQRLERDMQRDRHRQRRIDRQGRRWYGHLWVAKISLTGLLAGAWSIARRPQTALAVAGAAGLITVPMVVHPGQFPAGSAPPIMADWGSDQREPLQVNTKEPQAPPPPTVDEPVPAATASTAVAELPASEPGPAYTEPTLEPEEQAPTPDLEEEQAPTPEPVSTITVTAKPKPTPDPDVELTAEELCIEAGLGGVRLASCLRRLELGLLDLR